MLTNPTKFKNKESLKQWESCFVLQLEIRPIQDWSKKIIVRL